ncbi:MAG: hypothetical protein ACOYL3_02650 [Desulfuromonadaceae bacterium]
MVAGDQESNELEKLLADVQRTIRENEKFIRSLKNEAVESEEADIDEESNGDGTAVDGVYEEL